MAKPLIRILHFTRAERRGAAVLLLLAGLLTLAPEFLRRIYPRPSTDFAQLEREFEALHWEPAVPAAAALFAFDPNVATAGDFVRLGLSEKLARTILRYRERGGRYRRPEDFRKMYGLAEADYARLEPYLRLPNAGGTHGHTDAQPESPLQLFVFNPNEATEAQLVRLGIPRYVAARMLRYREKGGVFRTRADVQKMYGLPPDVYRRLEPYIKLPETGPPPPAAGYERRVKTPVVLDVNRATADDWQTLPGIGLTRAERIVRFRERLGGFTSVEQVAETRGLPDSVFQALRAFLVCAAPAVQKIRLNQAALEDLQAHPYFSYRQAAALIAYRSQHGPFRSLADLKDVVVLRDGAWLEKVGPYLDFE
jgi:competence protein ComEA